MVYSRTALCCSNRCVWSLMSRRFSLNSSHARMIYGINSNTPVHQSKMKSIMRNNHQQTVTFSSGKYSWSDDGKIGQTSKQEDEKFRTIYRHPDIRHYAMLSKFKSVVYVGTVANILYCCSTLQSPDTNLPMYLLGFSLTVVAAVSITSFSQYASRFVGVIRINEDTQTLKVSHLSFRGTRKDIYVDAGDIVPLLQTSYSDDNKVPFCTKDGKMNLYMSFTKGHILDHDIFYKLFR